MGQTWTEPLGGQEHDGRRDTKARLVLAARKAFDEIGYEATSVSDIVSRAEVSRATFYLYFTDKRDVYRAISEEFFDAVLEGFRALNDILASGSRDAFAAWLSDYMAWALDHAGDFHLWTETSELGREAATEMWRDAMKEWLGVMPWYSSQWSSFPSHVAFTRFGLFVGHLRFFHVGVFTDDERAAAIEFMADTWHTLLRPGRSGHEY